MLNAVWNFLTRNSGSIFDAVVKILLLFAGGYILWCGSQLAFVQGHDSMAIGLTYTAGIFCLIFAFLSSFKKFKGLGVKAEMWDQTQQKAEELVKQLEEIQVFTLKQILIIVTQPQGLGCSLYSKEHLVDLYKKVKALRSRVDAEEKDLASILHLIITLDYEPIRNRINAKLVEKKEEIEQKLKEMSADNTEVQTLQKNSEDCEKLYNVSKMIIPQYYDLPVTTEFSRQAYDKVNELIGELQSLNQHEKQQLKKSLHSELAELKIHCQSY
ncbi:MAG: hypothetical protein SFZ03_05545 [Candidatus Melainabacteria bacterium]|nr:hypothetical protein [Candidatus Melainabacteria bacterium]